MPKLSILCGIFLTALQIHWIHLNLAYSFLHEHKLKIRVTTVSSDSQNEIQCLRQFLLSTSGFVFLCKQERHGSWHAAWALLYPNDVIKQICASVSLVRSPFFWSQTKAHSARVISSCQARAQNRKHRVFYHHLVGWWVWIINKYVVKLWSHYHGIYSFAIMLARSGPHYLRHVHFFLLSWFWNIFSRPNTERR